MRDDQEIRDKARRRFDENNWPADPPETLTPHERKVWLEASLDYITSIKKFNEECG
jgi:hypothetical protein